MATHSSVLAGRIPGTGEPSGLYGVAQSDTTETTQQQQQHDICLMDKLQWVEE